MSDQQLLDFSFFFEPPDLTVLGLLHIEALAPLSLVVAQPGAYYRSQVAPTDHMLYGLLENALGWHLDVYGFKREDLYKALQKRAKNMQDKKSPWIGSDWLTGKANSNTSGVGFWSLLQHHLRFEPPHILPAVERYEDLWSQHLRDNGRSFFGGSRAYDYRLENLVTRTRAEDPTQEMNTRTKKRPPFIEMGDKASYQRVDLEDAIQFERGKLNYMSVRSAFPQYFVSPKKREYVIPQGPYLFRVRTSEAVSEMIAAALDNPAAPLYLGSNDGWVEVTWEVL